MTPIEGTYGGGDVALIARKTLAPVPVPKNGTATIEFDAKLTDVNSSNSGGGWIDRLLLINESWGYANRGISGLPITFSSSKITDGQYQGRFAITANGQPVIAAGGEQLGYDEAKWQHYKIDIINKNATTYYKLTVDGTESTEMEYSSAGSDAQIDAVRNIGWANDKKKDPSGTMNVGMQINELKIYTSELPLVMPDAKPAAWNVKISGNTHPNEIISAQYTYYQMLKKDAGEASYRWLKSTSVTGPFEPIDNETSITYSVKGEDASNYIKCEVTPADANGVKGAPVLSDAVKVTALPEPPVLTADEEAVYATAEALKINTENPDMVVGDLDLITTIGDGVLVTWDSDNVRAVANDGKVSRDETDAEAYLTATLRKGDASTKKMFKLRVTGIPRNGTDTVDISAYYNQDKYGYEVDKEEWRYNADKLYRGNVINGIPYELGPFEGDLSNSVLAAGQTISMPEGQYKAIYLLGSGEGNNAYKVNYSDGSSQNINPNPGGFMDWMADGSRNEAVIRTGTAIGPTNGEKIEKLAGMFKCTLYPDSTKRVTGITLPNNYTLIYAISVTTEDEPGFEPIKVAFAGDSITQGVGCHPQYTNTYTYQLTRMLGSKYKTFNYGLSGSEMSPGGAYYGGSQQYKELIASNPDIVVIMLGTNDGNKRWGEEGAVDRFKSNYKAMIETFRNLPSNPRIYACFPPGNGSGRDGMGGVINVIRELADEDPQLTVIDINTPTKYDMRENFPDGLHPNEGGHLVIARTMYQTLKEYSGNTPPVNTYEYSFADESGLEVLEPTRGGKVTVTASIDNSKGSGRTAMLITALCDESGKLLGAVETSEKKIAAGATDKLSVTLVLDDFVRGANLRSCGIKIL